MPAFAESARASRVGVDPLWGASCFQTFSPTVNQSGFDERYYNNTCLMQKTGQAYTLPFGGCDVTDEAQLTVMPHTANNTLYMQPGAPWALTCDAHGNATQLNFTQWQSFGFDEGSVTLEASTRTLTQLLQQAAEMLGMNTPEQPLAHAQ